MPTFKKLIFYLLLGWFVFTVYGAILSNLYRGYSPKIGLFTFHDFQEAHIPIEEIRLLPKHSELFCIFSEIPTGVLLASGPPAYIFNSEGLLIDYTSDVGDSTRFQKDFKVYDGQIVNLDNFKERISDKAEQGAAANP